MPLMEGSGKGIIGENIRELRGSGYPEDQSIAIAMRKAGKAKLPKVKKPHITRPGKHGMPFMKRGSLGKPSMAAPKMPKEPSVDLPGDDQSADEEE